MREVDDPIVSTIQKGLAVLMRHLLMYYAKLKTDLELQLIVKVNSADFFDYDLTAGSRTPPQSGGSSEPGAEPTLNEEVTQVVGQLGRLWGGFRKQVR